MATVRPARTTWIERASTDDARWVYFDTYDIISYEGAPAVWTQSGVRPTEYYYTGTFYPEKPAEVLIDGVSASEGAVGSLAAGEWGWDDVDALGADTIYVRLADDTDPDTKFTGHVCAIPYAAAAVVDADALMVGSKVAPSAPEPRQERYRCAIRFQQPTAPDWTVPGVGGPISRTGGTLLIVLDYATADTNRTVEGGVIGSGWDETTTALEFKTIGDAIGTWRSSTRIYNGQAAPQALYISDLPAEAAHGYMFRTYEVSSTSSRMTRLSTIPAPILLWHYQYTASSAARLDATERTDLDARVLAILNDRAEYRRFRTTLTVLASERDPSVNDVTLAHVVGAPSIISRRVNWPQAWLPDIPAAGGLPLSLVTDGDAVRGER